jgi:hypothetical protein
MMTTAIAALEAVVERASEPLDVLDDEVGALGGGVGEPDAVPAQDRDLPAGDGAGCSSSATSLLAQ